MGPKSRKLTARHSGASKGRHSPRPPVKLVVRVALSWRNHERRWKSIWQPVRKSIAKDAPRRLSSTGHGFAADGVVEARKLLAASGPNLFGAILGVTQEADVLIFVLTPGDRELAGPANVLREIGAALALERRAFLASECPGKVVVRGSDLAEPRSGA
jgi:hypothetical protein